ncbi:MAG TPA: amidohydrolase [Anaerolineales bacterium]|nr:amidohydrolase [Anaerolineales bacterium]
MSGPGDAAPMLLKRGVIYPRVGRPTTVSQAILAHGKVVAVGEDLGRRGTTPVDLEGRVVLPGLTDAHIHLEKYAHQLQVVDCETSTREECLRRVRQRAESTPPGAWILGHGWNQNDWGGFGTAADLDAAAPANPVYLTAKSLHAAWANTRALQAAGLASAPDPTGGRVQRDSSGHPTGILFEAAMDLITPVLPQPALESTIADILAAQSRLWRMGLTGVHDFDGRRCFEALQILREQRTLGLRVLKSIPHELLPHAVALGLRSGFGDDQLRIGHVKVFADGALGPRTAAMLAPYEGEPENLGMLFLDREAILETGIRAAEAGLALAIHAIGDRANHEVLEGLAALRRHEGEHHLPHRRHRIEHLQLLHSDDLHRPAELDVVASMQPSHATSDMSMADRYWGDRVAGAYAWQSELRSGATLAFGSDAPVESPDPFLGLYAAVTRRRTDGSPSSEGWTPAERIDIADALRGFTEGPAYAAGWDSSVGRLEPGSCADLIVLDRDPHTCPAEELLRTRVLGTMVSGSWVFRDF